MKPDRSEKFSSERVNPDAYQRSLEDRLIFLLHQKTYQHCRDALSGKSVLDLGCGDGFGAHMISAWASSVVAADVDAESIERAARTYAAPNLQFKKIEADAAKALPFADHSFDCVLCFQVIEHIQDDASFVKEIARMLKPGGILFLSTPNRSMRLFSCQNPWNKHHVREYSPRSLQRLLEGVFRLESLAGISFSEEWEKIERARIRRHKLLLFPFTNKLIPAGLRVFSLDLLWHLAVGTKKITRLAPDKPSAAQKTPAIDDVLIGHRPIDTCQSLLATCRKRAKLPRNNKGYWGNSGGN